MSSTRNLQIISGELLTEYEQAFSKEILSSALYSLEDAPLSTKDFNFYMAKAAVYSGRLEGEQIELDSYVKHKRFHIEFHPDYIRRTDDLYTAYQFASQHKADQRNIAKVHALLASSFVDAHMLGQVRTENISVVAANGEVVYQASPYAQVHAEMQKLYTDLELLLEWELTITETFYFASMLHLLFVKIHPWQDGNGRTARLLEKWFLAQKLGSQAWLVQSENYYFTARNAYYDGLRKLGSVYQKLQYKNALSFLLLLPKSLTAP